MAASVILAATGRRRYDALIKTRTPNHFKGALGMSMETLLKIREMGREIKRKRQNEEANFEYMTAPCGLPCFECYLYFIWHSLIKKWLKR